MTVASHLAPRRNAAQPPSHIHVMVVAAGGAAGIAGAGGKVGVAGSAPEHASRT